MFPGDTRWAHGKVRHSRAFVRKGAKAGSVTSRRPLEGPPAAGGRPAAPSFRASGRVSSGAMPDSVPTRAPKNSSDSAADAVDHHGSLLVPPAGSILRGRRARRRSYPDRDHHVGRRSRTRQISRNFPGPAGRPSRALRVPRSRGGRPILAMERLLRNRDPGVGLDKCPQGPGAAVGARIRFRCRSARGSGLGGRPMISAPRRSSPSRAGLSGWTPARGRKGEGKAERRQAGCAHIQPSLRKLEGGWPRLFSDSRPLLNAFAGTTSGTISGALEQTRRAFPFPPPGRKKWADQESMFVWLRLLVIRSRVWIDRSGPPAGAIQGETASAQPR